EERREKERERRREREREREEKGGGERTREKGGGRENERERRRERERERKEEGERTREKGGGRENERERRRERERERKEGREREDRDDFMHEKTDVPPHHKRPIPPTSFPKQELDSVFQIFFAGAEEVHYCRMHKSSTGVPRRARLSCLQLLLVSITLLVSFLVSPLVVDSATCPAANLSFPSAETFASLSYSPHSINLPSHLSSDIYNPRQNLTSRLF
ncbi:hypothetical protein L9F63_026395, partial [Diploptera punctata]